MASTAAAAVSISSCHNFHFDLVCSSNSGFCANSSSGAPLSLHTKSRAGISGQRSAGLPTLSGDGGRRRRRVGCGGSLSATGVRRRMLTPSTIRCGENDAQMSTEGSESGEPTFGTVFEPNRNFPETPPEWKEKEAARVAEFMEKEGISIRRHPASGPPLHNCGAFQFKLQNEGNTPTNILEEIIWFKDVEVTQMKEKTPLPALMSILKAVKPARDFIGALRERGAQTSQPALIAEVKKASPSRGVIQPNFDPVRIARAYESGGAACLSVLTDSKYFQGGFENLRLIRAARVECPLLCKEFIIDAWQLFYARAHGADAVLLIAAVLNDQDLRYFSKIAKSLGMAVLIEVHNDREMDRVLALPDVKMIGINNRNLGTFKVDINNTVQLLDGDRGRQISERGILVVGESGLFTPADIKVVRDAGVGAVLVGESLVKQDDPVAGIKALFGQDISQTSKSELEVTAAA